jgi:hypothetical protein
MSSVVSAAGRLVAVLPGGAWPGLEALAPAGVRWARTRCQAATPLLMSTPSPSGNARARACRAASRNCS